MSIKTVLYARVSTRDQAEEGYSLPAQERLLGEYARRNDLEIDRVFSVPESAAGRLERKTFKEMLEYLGANPNLKVILCEKVDRITRNFKDSVALDEWLNGDGERRIHFVKQGLVIHRDAKSGEKFQWDIHVVLARNYTNNLSEEVRKGQAEKIADGWLPGKPPLGYKNIETQGRMVQFIDPAMAPLVRRMFELYATGLYSTKLLGDIMYEEGLRTRNGCRLVKSRLHSLLQDPYYYGMIRWNGKFHQGKHEPIISRDLFRTAQDVLDGKNNPKHRKYLPLFKALVRCGDCGGTVTWQIQKNHWYGRCNRRCGCGQKKYTRQERLEEKIHECLDGLTAGDSRVIEWIRKALKESHRDETEYNRSCLEELNRRYETLQRREDALYDDKVDGKIIEEFYERKFKQYSGESEEVLDSIRRHETGRAKYFELGRNILELAQRAKEIYISRSVEEKRQLLKLVFSNLVLKDGNLRPDLHPAFRLIAEKAKTDEQRRG